MAVEVESSSQVEDFIGVLKRRWLYIVIPAAIVTTIGTAFATIVPKKYVCETKVLVREVQLARFKGQTAASSQEAIVASHQIKSLARITEALEKLRWPQYMELAQAEKQAYLSKIRDNLKIDKPSLGKGATQHVVTISYADGDPQRCYDLLKEISTAWQDEVLKRGRNAEHDAFNLLKERVAELEKNRARLALQIQNLRKEYNITPPIPGQRPSDNFILDPIFVEIDQDERAVEKLRREIEVVEQLVADNTEVLLRMEPTVTRTLKDDGTDNDLRIANIRLTIKDLRDSQRGYKKLHSKYKAYQKSIEEMQSNITFLEDSEVLPSETENTLTNKAYTDLAKLIGKQEIQLRNQKTRETNLLNGIEGKIEESRQLQEVHSKIATMASDVMRINDELGAVDEEFLKQKQVIAYVDGPGGNPFDVLDKPVPPASPTEPNPLLYIIFSVFMGLGGGLAFAVIGEYTKNCYRSVNDVARVMVAPVLGCVNTITTRRERRTRFFQRFLVTSTTLLFVTAVAYVTWAWAEQPNRLSTGVNDAIEDIRSKLE